MEISVEFNENQQKDDKMSNLKMSLKPNEPKFNPFKKSIFSDSATPSMYMLLASQNGESFQSFSPTKYMNSMNHGNEEKENQKEEHIVYTSRTNSIKGRKAPRMIDYTALNKNEDKNTANPNKINTLEVKTFSYQEEQKDINFIMKAKSAKTFVNFIDIDLFLQYLALDKNFVDKEDENDNLLEGFSLQYQAFMRPENLINKLISCFNFFYSKYLKNEPTIKIPFGLIDFLYIFIKMHNTYYQDGLTFDLTTKLNDFVKYLMGITDVKKKYAKLLQLSENELKDYDTWMKKISSHKTTIGEAIEENMNSDEEDSDKDDKIKVNTKNKAEYKTVRSLNPCKTINFEENLGYIESESNERKKTSDEIKIVRRIPELNDVPYEFDILKFSDKDIASELTRVNYTLYSKIKIKEFLKGAFNGKDKFKSSPHVCQIVNRFNKLSYFVVEEILSYDHAEKRAEILLKFIKLCDLLKDLGNFDDLLSIMTGLSNNNISKLNKTWGHIPSTDVTNFRQMKKILSFEDNWKYLRKEIQKKIDSKSFYIPYLGYYTKKMLYLEELGPYVKKNTTLINLEKIIEVYKVIKNFYLMKNVKFTCSISESVKQELRVLQCLDPSNEDFLVETSNLLEPKFILSNKKLKVKRRTKTDINFIDNVNKFNLL